MILLCFNPVDVFTKTSTGLRSLMSLIEVDILPLPLAATDKLLVCSVIPLPPIVIEMWSVSEDLFSMVA